MIALALFLAVVPAPPVSDALRFPQTPQAATELATFADAHVKWLESHDGHLVMVPVPRAFWIESVPVESDWLIEARWRRDCWQALKQAKSGVNVVGSLAWLHELLGDTAYAFGLMPAPVPSQRFRLRERDEK